MKRTLAAVALTFAFDAAAQSCRVDVTPLAFGVYDPASVTATTVRTEIALVCGGGAAGEAPASATVRLAGDAARALAGAGHELRYVLFQDAATSRPWRDADAATVALPPAADGRASEVRVPVYGRIAPGQWVPPGVYSGVVEVVVTF